MLGTMLAAGLLPLAGWGLVSRVALGGFLSFSLAPLEAQALRMDRGNLHRRISGARTTVTVG